MARDIINILQIICLIVLVMITTYACWEGYDWAMRSAVVTIIILLFDIRLNLDDR